jgi:hypothetical protein
MEPSNEIVQARENLINARRCIAENTHGYFYLLSLKIAITGAMLEQPDKSKAAILKEIECGLTNEALDQLLIQGHNVSARIYLKSTRANASDPALARSYRKLFEAEVSAIMDINTNLIRSVVLNEIEPDLSDAELNYLGSAP